MKSINTKPEILQLEATVQEMRELKRWARFLGIVGMIVSAFLLIVSVFGGSILRNLEQASVDGGKRSAVFVMILLVLATIAFTLAVILLMFSNSIKLSDEGDGLRNTFRYLKNYFRTAGVFILVLMLLIVLQSALGIFY
ncbi:MAG: hypothetical protein EOO01_24690 [Chitinophagaceae bacterium]|nr:MAG: hypothetical protein EOO01_24690 [Chitinophagaceae bacterium]